MKKSTLFFTGANFIGILLFLRFVVSAARLARLEERTYYDFGDSLNFIITTDFVLVPCLLLSAGWSIKALQDISKHKDYQASKALAVVIAAWGIAYVAMRILSRLT